MSGRLSNRKLLLVAYPLLPVSDASAGGAEQILWTLERELARRGWETEVAACAGSSVAGKLLATGEAPRELDGFAEREREHSERVAAACAEGGYAMVLDHSGHFFRHVARYAEQVRVPVLAALHLPRELYAPESFAAVAKNVYFHCVSEPQRREFMDLPRMMGVVRNGIAVERFGAPEGKTGEAKRNYLLWLGRVCPEKAPHLAIAAARKAGVPIVLAGQVYPFAWHRQYWEERVRPLIAGSEIAGPKIIGPEIIGSEQEGSREEGERVRWVALPSFAEKARLLREALALLVTSQVNETTSLVALEAMASGTPVIAFRRGALSEVVTEATGYLVESVDEMAEACSRLGAIRAEDCRRWVEENYSAEAMADGYERMMRELAGAR